MGDTSAGTRPTLAVGGRAAEAVAEADAAAEALTVFAAGTGLAGERSGRLTGAGEAGRALTMAAGAAAAGCGRRVGGRSAGAGATGAGAAGAGAAGAGATGLAGAGFGRGLLLPSLVPLKPYSALLEHEARRAVETAKINRDRYMNEEVQ